MLRSIRAVIVACALSAGLLAAQTPQQPQPAPADQQPVFRTGINFVRVDVIITDSKGNPVGDLEPAVVMTQLGPSDMVGLMYPLESLGSGPGAGGATWFRL